MSSTISIVKSLKVEELGVVDYLTAWELQKQIQEKVANNQIENRFLMLFLPSRKGNTVDVAQLVRALDCGSRGRGFEPHLPPKKSRFGGIFYFTA